MNNKTNIAVQALNAIRNSASIEYRNYIPVAYPAQDSILNIGSTMRDYPFLYNEYIDLIGRFVRYEYSARMMENHLAFGKRGMLPYGKTVGEIFQGLAEPFQFDANTNNLWNVVPPDIQTAYHVVNSDIIYQVDISPTALDSAFLSWDEQYDFIERVIRRMYDSAAYDDEQKMKYLIAINLLSGNIKSIGIQGTATEDASRQSVKTIKKISNNFVFPKTEYNRAGVLNHCAKDEQYIIMNADYDAATDVDVLAQSFNMDKAEFEGHRVLIDSFGSLNQERLAKLVINYVEISANELAALDTVGAVLMSKDWFLVYDSAFDMDSQKISKRRSYQYSLHNRQMLSTSPFQNCVAFSATTPSIKSVSVTPSTATLNKGETLQIEVNVITAGFAPQTVTWESDDVNTTVTASGFVTTTNKSAPEVKIKAISTFDGKKTATATLSII